LKENPKMREQMEQEILEHFQASKAGATE